MVHPVSIMNKILKGDFVRIRWEVLLSFEIFIINVGNVYFHFFLLNKLYTNFGLFTQIQSNFRINLLFTYKKIYMFKHAVYHHRLKLHILICAITGLSGMWVIARSGT